jgi:ZIP family zinc transporter
MLMDLIILSLIAGAATGIGGAIAVVGKPGKRMFGFLMGFSGGIMLSISFTELLAQGIKFGGLELAIIGFTLGSLSFMLLDTFLPHVRFATKEKGIVNTKLLRMGMLLAIGISIHNIPEGMAVGSGYVHLPALGLIIAIGIALHNIPEGMATALPLYSAGFSRKKSFLIALGSGLVEPVGAAIAYLFLSGFPALIPATLAFAAGVMVFITLDELLPIAEAKSHNAMSAGILLGIIFMLLVSNIFGI